MKRMCVEISNFQVLLLLLLRNPQNQTEYNYEKLNLTIMVNS